MLCKVIYHYRKPCKTSETFDRFRSRYLGSLLISEANSVVSGVMASCNIKQVSFFFLSIFRVKKIGKIGLFCFKIDVLLFLYIQTAC